MNNCCRFRVHLKVKNGMIRKLENPKAFTTGCDLGKILANGALETNHMAKNLPHMIYMYGERGPP